MNDYTITPLDPKLAAVVLQHLGIDEADEPTPDLLDSLVAAYTRRVPWESFSRIARRAQIRETVQCPRWPDTFWKQTMQSGTGGTCYESNYAFFSLLRTLGYEGYLTINNMRESIGCHSASVIEFSDDERWLVDVGIPLHVPIPLGRDSATHRQSPFHTYTITPLGDEHYEIRRDLHPSPYIFTLIDRPVTEADYRQITTNDYEPDSGLFLDRAIITRVVNERVWRFGSENVPYQLAMFHDGAVTYHYIGDEIPQVATSIQERFQLEGTIVQRALDILR